MSPAATTAVESRASKRAGVVHAQRRAGNGTVADVAAFCCVSVRTVLNWKGATPPVIGYSQIGDNIWFSPDDVAALARGHRLGKYSTIPACEIEERVRRQWKEFLRGEMLDAEFEKRLAALEVLAGIGADSVNAGLQTRRAA